MAASSTLSIPPPRSWKHPRTWQQRRPGHVFPFRIPFFRIFYSTTYTTLFLVLIVLLAITPASMIWTSIQTRATQYTIMIGGVYVLVVVFTLFIYSSRVWTNRRSLAEVGKAYLPIEEGEVGRSVRKLIKGWLDRSAVIAWESRPRDLEGEILHAEQEGILPALGVDGLNVHGGEQGYTVGTVIEVDPAYPPWGRVTHPGWSSPSHRRDNPNPHVQFSAVYAELPNLIEAKAVTLAPNDPLATPHEDGSTAADENVVKTLRRAESMGVREYLTQLRYLGLVNPPEVGHRFLTIYERARFSSRPLSEEGFNDLMELFAQLLDGMSTLAPEIVDQIRLQTRDSDASPEELEAPPVPLRPEERSRMTSRLPSPTPSNGSIIHYKTPSPPQSLEQSSIATTPVTAPTSRLRTPYLGPDNVSNSSLGLPPKTPTRPSTPARASNNPVEEISPRTMPGSRPAPSSPFGDNSNDANSSVLTGEESLRSDSEASLADDAGSVIVKRSSDSNG